MKPMYENRGMCLQRRRVLSTAAAQSVGIEAPRPLHVRLDWVWPRWSRQQLRSLPRVFQEVLALNMIQYR